MITLLTYLHDLCWLNINLCPWISFNIGLYQPGHHADVVFISPFFFSVPHGCDDLPAKLSAGSCLKLFAPPSLLAHNWFTMFFS